MTKSLLTVGAIATALLSTPAFAANNRTWISGKGTDTAGCGPVATPCRTLQYAHDNTNAGGEIDVLDAAGYGSVFITKAISIINDGVGTAGVLATGGNAIWIAADSSDDVVLRGLTIEGAKTAVNGIKISGSLRSLTIANSVIQDFVNFGIISSTRNDTTTIRILNTTIANNTFAIVLGPQSGATGGEAILDHVTLTGNDNTGLSVSPGPASGVFRLTVSNSLVASNAYGIDLSAGTMGINAVLTGNVITTNKTAGMRVGGASTSSAAIGGNTIAHNGTGVSISDGIPVNSFGNNQFANNGTDVSGTLTTVARK